MGAAKVDAMRQAGTKSLDNAKAFGNKGMEGIRSATAAGSAACSSGIEKVRGAIDPRLLYNLSR